jgi:hypothetical protein
MALVSVFKDKDKDFVLENIPFDIGSFCLEYKGDLKPFITSYLDFENFINENKQYILTHRKNTSRERTFLRALKNAKIFFEKYPNGVISFTL